MSAAARARRLVALLVALVGALPAGAPGRAADLPFSRLTLTLPGAPSELLASDLDGDGRRDLVLFVAWASWGEVGVEEEMHLDEVAGLVAVMTVVPAMLDRREIRVHPGLANGGFAVEPWRLEVGPGVHALAHGPSFAPLLALTDEGVAALRLTPGDGETRRELQITPLVAEPPVLAGSDVFVPRLPFTASLDGNGEPDLPIPVDGGVAVHLAAGDRFIDTGMLELPADDPRPKDGALVRNYPLPLPRDLDADGRPDLLIAHPRRGWDEATAYRNLGGGRFGPPLPLARGIARESAAQPAEGEATRPGVEVLFLGDLDGDTRAEALAVERREPGDEASLRQNLDYARRPPARFRVHRLDGALAAVATAAVELATEGHFVDDGEEAGLSSGLLDLDGDGRLDLVTLTLDFSVLQAARVLATKRISIGVDFLVHCQQPDGRFRPVTGLDLGGKFELDLDDLKIGRLSQFAGDFDGDGRLDFLQLGRGRRATIHRGAAGCRYPKKPDFEVELVTAPLDLALTRVDDWNGDGRSDLAVVRPGVPPARRASAAASAAPDIALDLYLSTASGTR